jgi:cytochrome c-type biogenesis protein CcsB
MKKTHPGMVAATLAALFLCLAAAPPGARAAGDKLNSPFQNDRRFDSVERAIVESVVPLLAIQHRGLDIALAHRARYALSDMTGKTRFAGGEDATFTYLGMLYAPDQWGDTKLFPIEHPKLAERLRRHRKDRLTPNELTPALLQYLGSLERLGRAMPEHRARRLVDLPEDNKPFSDDDLARAFARTLRIHREMQALRQAGHKLDVEMAQQMKAALDEDSAAFRDPREQPATAAILEVIRVNYLVGAIPRERVIDFMVVAADQLLEQGAADPSALQLLINDTATFGFPDKSLMDATLQLFSRYSAFNRRLEEFRIVPVPGSLENLWVSPPEAATLRSADAKPIAEAAWNLHAALAQAYQQGNAGELQETAAEFLALAQQDERYTSEWRRFSSHFYTVRQPYLGALLLYLAAALAFAWAARRGGAAGWSYRAALGLLVAGFAIHSFGILCRVSITGRAPVSNIWESIIWVTWGGLLFGLFFETRFRSIFPGLLTGAVGFCALLASYSMPNETAQMQPLRAVLVSSWLTYHVLAITLSYAAFMISAAFSISYLIKDGTLLGWLPGGRALSNALGRLMPDEATLELFAYRAIQIGYPLLTWGIFSGAVWADHAWGRFWAWDPKETWSLITWLIYTAFLHMRLRRGLSGRSLALMALGGFACVLITWLGVSYMPIFAGLHSYANG